MIWSLTVRLRTKKRSSQLPTGVESRVGGAEQQQPRLQVPSFAAEKRGFQRGSTSTVRRQAAYGTHRCSQCLLFDVTWMSRNAVASQGLQD